MEQVIIQLLGGKITVDAILLLLIMAFVTKRIVPWWVYETMEQKLKEHEDASPSLVNAVGELVDAIDSISDAPEHVREKQEELRNALQKPRQVQRRKITRQGGAIDRSVRS